MSCPCVPLYIRMGLGRTTCSYTLVLIPLYVLSMCTIVHKDGTGTYHVYLYSSSSMYTSVCPCPLVPPYIKMGLGHTTCTCTLVIVYHYLSRPFVPWCLRMGLGRTTCTCTVVEIYHCLSPSTCTTVHKDGTGTHHVYLYSSTSPLSVLVHLYHST